MIFDWLIICVGYSGCVIAERIATQLGKKVLIVEQRDHIGGNAYDYYNEHDILVHKCGLHIFHTKSQKVWNYLSQFTEWRHYYHHVLGVVEGKKIPILFNLNSLDREYYQEVGTVNYPNDYDITRITEQKYLSGQTSAKTTLVMEYPRAYVPGQNDPYYPVLNEANRDRLSLYLKEVDKLNGTVLFAGRLGDYKYYNMDQAVVRALGLFAKEIANPTQELQEEQKKLVSV